MKHHVTKLAMVGHYHLRRLWQIRRRVGMETTTRLVLAMTTSQLDYCNSVLAGLLQSTLNPLQRLQNAAARVIFNVGKQEHVSPYLEQLQLATSTSTGAVQIVHSDARHPQQTMSSVPR